MDTVVPRFLPYSELLKVSWMFSSLIRSARAGLPGSFYPRNSASVIHTPEVTTMIRINDAMNLTDEEREQQLGSIMAALGHTVRFIN